MGPVPRRGTHAPVRAPHGEHADKRGPGGASALVTRGHRLAPALAQDTVRGTPIGSRIKLGSSRRVPRNPSTLLLPKLGPKRIRESDDAPLRPANARWRAGEHSGR